MRLCTAYLDLICWLKDLGLPCLLPSVTAIPAQTDGGHLGVQTASCPAGVSVSWPRCCLSSLHPPQQGEAGHLPDQLHTAALWYKVCSEELQGSVCELCDEGCLPVHSAGPAQVGCGARAGCQLFFGGGADWLPGRGKNTTPRKVSKDGPPQPGQNFNTQYCLTKKASRTAVSRRVPGQRDRQQQHGQPCHRGCFGGEN